MYSLRTHVWILLGLLAAVILLGIGGNILAAEGFQPMLDRVQLPLQILFFGLVLALVFAFIPVMVKLVIGVQVKANAELAVVRSLAAQQNKIIWGIWILLALGLAVAIPAAIQDGFFGSASTPAAAADLAPSQGTADRGTGHGSRRHAGRDDADRSRVGTSPMFPLPAVPSSTSRSRAPTPSSGNAATTSSRCRARIPARIEALSIGTAVRKMSRAELDAANAAMRTQLKAEGWLAGP